MNLRSLAIGGWACLALLPPEFLAAWRGWELVDPPYLVLLLLWWPVDTWARLNILALLLRRALPPKNSVPAALNAEALLSFKSGSVLLLGLIPALAWLAAAGGGPVFFGLACLGLLPAFYFYLSRSLAPVGILLRHLSGPEALDWSRQILQGRMTAFLRLAWPWWLLALVLDGVALAASAGQISVALTGFLSVLSLVTALIPLARFVAHDGTS